MKPFYGDELVHQIISKSKLEKLTKNNKKYTINLNKDDYINLVNICVGLYSPLKGFCDYRDYCSIIEKNKMFLYKKFTSYLKNYYPVYRSDFLNLKKKIRDNI